MSLEILNNFAVLRFDRETRMDAFIRIRNGGGLETELYELCEDLVGNGWMEWIRPEEIGALTDAPMFSVNAERDEEGKLIDPGTVYWFPCYETMDPVECIILDGWVQFNKAD